MMRTFTTVVTADYFQSYIPLFVAALRTWSKDHIRIFLRGAMSPRVKRAMEYAGQCDVVENFAEEYPHLASTTNSLRFIIDGTEGATMITDVDMLLFQDPWEWHLSRITTQNPFCAHRGPHKKPHRPEVCDRWAGPWERVAGGMVCLGPGWWDKTRSARTLWSKELLHGRWGGFREADEVMLARIIKLSDMVVPTLKALPPELRGLHLGDFKTAMDHRWTDLGKMLSRLTTYNCQSYLVLRATTAWQEMVSLLQNETLNGILKNVDAHISKRMVFV